MITVRPARIEDAEAMSALLVASISELCFADHQHQPEALARWLANKTPEGVRGFFANPQNRLFVAEQDGALAAVGGCNDAREIILNYVAPAHRFSGASSALLSAMEAELGPGEATLSSTLTALRFYLRRGWSETGALDRYAGMIAYPMCKQL